MDETLELVCKALDELADSFLPQKNEKRILVEFVGWHTPSLSFEDLSNIPRYLAKEIRDAKIEEISELTSKLADAEKEIAALTQKVKDENAYSMYENENIKDQSRVFLSGRLDPLLETAFECAQLNPPRQHIVLERIEIVREEIKREIERLQS